MSEQRTRQRFFVHVCVLDQQCRYYAGWMWRLHVNTRWWHLGLALRPADRFADTNRTGWITFQRW